MCFVERRRILPATRSLDELSTPRVTYVFVQPRVYSVGSMSLEQVSDSLWTIRKTNRRDTVAYLAGERLEC